jgi:hypothetical protein
MESHRYKKPRGAPSLSANSVPKLERSDAHSMADVDADNASSCHHINTRGHRCRMLCAPHSDFCVHHAQRLARPKPDDEAVAAELLSSIEDFTTAASVNLFLGNLTKQLARKRIQRRDAVALAYLSQLLLNSLSAMNREDALNEEAEPARPREIIWDFCSRPNRAPAAAPSIAPDAAATDASSAALAVPDGAMNASESAERVAGRVIDALQHCP